MADPESENPSPVPERAPTDGAEAPQKIRRRRRLSWCRLRIYFWAILLVLAIDFYATARMIREQPKRMVEMVLARLPFPASIATAKWTGPRTLEITGLQLGGFFYADSVVVTAHPWQLMRHHITQVDVFRPQLFTKKLSDVLKQGKHADAKGLDWTITKLTLSRGTLMLEDLAPDVPTIPIRFGIYQPIILNYLKLNSPNGSNGMSRERTIDIQNVNIVSPVDPLAPVLTLPLIKLRFTYNEVWHHYIREVDLIKPTLHLGQDLFYFTDAVEEGAQDRYVDQRRERAVENGALRGPLRAARRECFRPARGAISLFLRHVGERYSPRSARQDIGEERRRHPAPEPVLPRLQNPRGESHRENRVQLSAQRRPRQQRRAHRAHRQAGVEQHRGGQRGGERDLRSDGHLRQVRGDCEKGKIDGGFSVDYTKNFLWKAKVTAAGVDCLPVSQKLVGKYFSLSGVLDGDISVTGQAVNIQRCQGQLAMRHPGNLEIHSMDHLMQNLPGKAGSLEQKTMRIGLEAFREYPYDTGAVNIDWSPDEGGQASLKLTGPRGKREFEAFLHPYDGTSKVAKDDDDR